MLQSSLSSNFFFKNIFAKTLPVFSHHPELLATSKKICTPIRLFSVFAHLIPPRIPKISRKRRRAKKLAILLKRRSLGRPRKRFVFKVRDPNAVRPKRRFVHKNKKYRFPRWKFYYRRFWRNRFRHSPTGSWIIKDLLSYRLLRRPQQPFRRKNPRFTKKNKFYRNIQQYKRPGATLSKHHRLVSHQSHFKMITNFFGQLTPKQRELQGKHRRRSKYFGQSKRQQARWWFERRIDASLCRRNLAPSIKVARALIRGGFAFVDNKQLIDPRGRVDFWSIITLAPQNLRRFLRYWYRRNRFQRYAFKNKGLRFNNRQQLPPIASFGFWHRLFGDWDIPRYDRIQGYELHRLTLGFNGYYR